jgi:hypothetical protein
VQQAASFIEEALDFEPVGYAVAPSPELPWSMFAVSSAQALREDWGRPEDPQGMRVVACLHNDPAHAEELGERSLRDCWRSSLRAANLFRCLPRVWLLAEGDQGQLDYGRLASLYRGVDGGGAWDALRELLRPDCLEQFDSLREAGLPLPEVGLDLPDRQGHSSGICAELAWPEARLALLVADEREELARRGLEVALAEGWSLLPLEELELEEVRGALHAKRAGL